MKAITRKGGSILEKVESLKAQKFPTVNYQSWREEAEKTLKGKPVEKLSTCTYEDISLKPIYTKEDTAELEHMNDLPGLPYFKRGVEKLGYVTNPWKVSQEIASATIHDANAILKHDLARGQTMVNMFVNHSQHKPNRGITILTLKDLTALFEGITINKYPLLIDTDLCSLPFTSLLIAYCNEKNISLESINGTIGMDPLGSFVSEGKLSIPLKKLYDIMALQLTWAKESAPQLRTILVKGQPYHNGGASAVQELAFTLAAGVDYIQECQNRGLTIDDITPRMLFSFSVGSNLFMEVAKLRAARLLWTKVVEAYDGNDDSKKMNIHARTSSYTKTVYDPYVNMLRSTTEAFAAAIGGVESLHVSTFDEALRNSNDFSRRIARNTQIILQEESHLNKVVDPAGGSWYIETLTSEVADKAWSLFQQVEDKGGFFKALQEGFIQSEIKNVSETKQENVKSRKDKIVGTNFYANLSEKPLTSSAERLSVSNETIRRLQVNEAINKELGNAINENDETLVKLSVEFLSSGASVEELLSLFKESSSEGVEPVVAHRLAEPFEELRNAAIVFKNSTGDWPKIGLINLGPISIHKPRADFITGFFEAGGFQVVKNAGYQSIEEAVQGYRSTNLSTNVICGSDELYAEMVEELVTKIKAINPKTTLFVAGKQATHVGEQFVNAGVSDFIHIKSNCYDVLKKLQLEMGVR